ncbi:BREX system Lon protease-like protein BrxL [Orenia marismortui]|uniref:ATP-dependent Lon protease n=1 Tax=Orenia marismortui TaxID=46469 RepID=A0A4R8H1K9_9FIRM|nr:BREX system Lon protease-like protein BrxL [Orenia marismortui]TDX48450.1 ATP-dependent Lon protease [Orenia marismortui]
MGVIDYKAKQIYPDLIIDKGFVLKFKEKLNIPTYILEQLILKYSDQEVSDNDITQISEMLKSKIVKAKDNLKIQAKIRDKGKMDIIDKLKVVFNKSTNRYEGRLLNLAIKEVLISDSLIKEYPNLLEGGLWAELTLSYSGKEKVGFQLEQINPLQSQKFDFDDFKVRRAKMTKFQWIGFLLRSIGLEPLKLSKRKKLLYLSLLIPFVEQNYNFIELGLRGTGKSYLYRQLSQESILVSGGKTTVANLFYNMGTRQVGLLGKNDVVAFDEVAYIDFKDKTAIQILKDYMESGSFSRGKEEINTEASMVFLGNINEDITMLLTNSHLFSPLPRLMQDIALMDRFHFYLPGWEMDKLKEDSFTKHSGLQSSYLASALNKLRQLDFTDVIDDYFSLDKELDIRDERAIKKTISGFLKLIHPDGVFTKEDLKIYLDIALEGRKRIKQQLVKVGDFEYKDVKFEYIDLESKEKCYTLLPEEKLKIESEDRLSPPGTVYIGEIIEGEQFGLLKLVIVAKPGRGKILFRGELDNLIKRSLRKTFLLIKQRRLRDDLKTKLNNNDFYVLTKPILNQIKSDISNAFFIAVYSLLNNKSVTDGLLVTKDSSFYRKNKSAQAIKSLKVEGEYGESRLLFPLKSKTFIELPSELSIELSTFITV